MTRKACFDIVRSVVNAFGFVLNEHKPTVDKTIVGSGYWIADPMDIVCVNIHDAEHMYDKGWATITRILRFTACAKYCGGKLSSSEMMKTAARMAQTAAMLKVFDEMELSYTEDISFKEEAK